MSFSNEFLCDFKPVYEGILAAKGIKPERAVVEVIDEEQEGAGMFEPAGALEVLEQITRLKLYRIKRLCHIIIGTYRKSKHLIGILTFCRKKYYGYI